MASSDQVQRSRVLNKMDRFGVLVDVALFLPFGCNNGQQSAANGGTERKPASA